MSNQKTFTKGMIIKMGKYGYPNLSIKVDEFIENQKI